MAPLSIMIQLRVNFQCDNVVCVVDEEIISK